MAARVAQHPPVTIKDVAAKPADVVGSVKWISSLKRRNHMVLDIDKREVRKGQWIEVNT
jgi:hypothetical protein